MTTHPIHEEKHPATDSEVRKKAVRLVVAHLKKKVTGDFPGIDYLASWLDEMEDLMAEDAFDIREYHRMHRELNSVIESTLDEAMRDSLRNSWYSMGKSLEKKAKPM
jgi:hypothetical protein